MNSRYKFRAFDKETDSMIYDVQDAYDGLSSDNNSLDVNEEYAHVCCFSDFIDSEKFILMQCTGLKDKNGIEIYEGDIVKSQNGTGGLIYIHFVEWNDFYKRFEPMGAESSCFNRESCEVIGNIYENPELLDKH